MKLGCDDTIPERRYDAGVPVLYLLLVPFFVCIIELSVRPEIEQDLVVVQVNPGWLSFCDLV